MIAAECLLWLRNGTWIRWPLRDVTAMPEVRAYDPNDWMVMRGADHIAHWIGSIPTSLVLLATGLALAWNANGSLEKAEARADERRRQIRRT